MQAVLVDFDATLTVREEPGERASNLSGADSFENCNKRQTDVGRRSLHGVCFRRREALIVKSMFLGSVNEVA